MSKINEKYLKRCIQTNCFKIAKFSEKELMTFEYEKPLDYFNYFWKKYEKFKSDYLKKNKESINNNFTTELLLRLSQHSSWRREIKF